MKTLVIHPEDVTTDFLKGIYRDIPDATVITKGLSRPQLVELIGVHDRVMMLGHGSSSGLFSMGWFFEAPGYIISHSMVEHLKEKDNNICIWCNADKYVDAFQLKGFYSGMFISEPAEASFCRVYSVTPEMIEESNHAFAHMISQNINLPKQDMHARIMREYGKLALKNPVASYNCQRLYVR